MTDSFTSEIFDVPEETVDKKWDDVVTFLRFSKSYHPGVHLFDEAHIITNLYIEKITHGYTDFELALVYETTLHSAWSAKNAVQRVEMILEIAESNVESQITDRERRILEIYKSFKSLPSYLEEEITNKTELGILLQRNADIKDLLFYLSTGRSLAEYISEFSILGITPQVTNKLSSSIINSVVYNQKPDRNPHQIILKKASSHLVTNDVDIQGKPAYDRLYYPIAKVLKYPENIKGEVARSLSAVRKFLELTILLHYHAKQNERNRFGSCQWFDKSKNPYDINPVDYYLNMRNKRIISPGIKIILENFLSGQMKENVYSILSKNTPYSNSTLEDYFNNGLRFLGNILLDRTKMSLSFEELVRNRREEANKIMNIIANRS